jgi:hypothetical protein
MTEVADNYCGSVSKCYWHVLTETQSEGDDVGSGGTAPPLLISPLDGGNRSKLRYPLDGRLRDGRSVCLSEHCRQEGDVGSVGRRTPDIQSTARRYTDSEPGLEEDLETSDTEDACFL